MYIQYVSICSATTVMGHLLGSSLHSAALETRPRVHSHHLRELTLGKLIIKYQTITLQDNIGEGIKCNNYNIMM